MMSRRVVVTGFGAITSLGHTIEETWAALKAGKSGVGYITHFDTTTHRVKIAAEVKNWHPENHFPPKEVRRYDRYQLFVYAAALQAIQHAGWGELTAEQRPRTSVVIGSSIGGVVSFQDHVLEICPTQNWRQISPYSIPKLTVDGGSNSVGILLRATGLSPIPVSGCATGSDCIGQAAEWIRMGRIDRALAGGGDAPITSLGVATFDRVGAISHRNDTPATAMRPFAKDRDGLVFAEGAAVMVLEELETARGRGATIWAELVGYGCTSDAYHATAPEPEGLGASAAIQAALESAQLRPADIQYINAHGTATGLNDPMETKAIKRVFGDYAHKIPISGTKSMTGHAMGMTAALEAIFCVLAIHDQVAPPTINLFEPDPECDLDFVPHTARNAPITYALTNAFGFGGHNSVLIFKKVV